MAPRRPEGKGTVNRRALCLWGDSQAREPAPQTGVLGLLPPVLPPLCGPWSHSPRICREAEEPGHCLLDSAGQAGLRVPQGWTGPREAASPDTSLHLEMRGVPVLLPSSQTALSRERGSFCMQHSLGPPSLPRGAREGHMGRGLFSRLPWNSRPQPLHLQALPGTGPSLAPPCPPCPCCSSPKARDLREDVSLSVEPTPAPLLSGTSRWSQQEDWSGWGGAQTSLTLPPAPPLPLTSPAAALLCPSQALPGVQLPQPQGLCTCWSSCSPG